MIRHVVSWKLAAEDVPTKLENSALIAQTLQALVSKIPQIRSLTVGSNVAFPEDNWDLVLIADYDDLAGLEAYQVHPDHVAATLVIKPLVALRSNVDFEL
ncbi:MAG: stress responsive alpha-beta barrel protein [Microbacteriaceae bacterium]|nr:stress responsive alpha-beta barrel protein [Microbacteriaceae bacterium]